MDAQSSVRLLMREADQVVDDKHEDGVPITIILGGVLGSVDDLAPLEREAYLRCRSVQSQVRELLVLTMTAADMELPEHLTPGGHQDVETG